MPSAIDDLPPPPSRAVVSGIDDLPPPPSPSLGQRALGAIQSGLSTVDSYTGAPLRAAIVAGQNASPSDPLAMGHPIDRYKAMAGAFAGQFGKDPSQAPSSEDVAVNSGLQKDSIPEKALAFAVDMAGSPISYIPIGDMIASGVKGAGSAVGLGSKAVEAAADGVPAVAANAAKDVTSIAPVKPGVAAKAAGLTAETFTGVDKNLASNYAANTDRVNDIINHYSGPEGYSEAAHAADIRGQWRSVIQDTRQKMNTAISSALDGEAGQASVSGKSVMDGIDASIAKANPATQAKDIQSLQDLKSTLGKMTDSEGNISLKNLHDFKQYAQKSAAPAYDAVGNAIFPGGEFAAKQAKGIAGASRELLVNNAPKSVSEAEGTLASLHNAEDSMNSTLLKDNGPVHAISRSGVNPGGIEARSLNQLGDITGYNFAQDAKDFSTARAFASPKFTPEFNGKSLLRAGLGAGAGYAAGGIAGLDPETQKYLAFAGGALSSPGMLKAGMNMANLGGKLIAAPPQAIYGALTSPSGRAAIDLGTKAALSQPQVAGSPQSPSNLAQSQPNRSPARGEDLWAQQGLSKLGIQDQETMNQLLQDPKAKQLLIQASDLAPGSQAMKNIQTQIQKGWGRK